MNTIKTVNIRPSVGVLYNMRNMNYEPSFALAEFIDNSIESYLNSEDEIKTIDGADARLKISIKFKNDVLEISDNAAGINSDNYIRAFTCGVRPTHNARIYSEFGQGMKAAACWFADNWEVTTTALGEPIGRIVKFDMINIMENNIEELDVEVFDANPNEHKTSIKLYNLLQQPYGTGYTAIQNYLTSIYRLLLKEGKIDLYCLNKSLTFKDNIDILRAPPHNKEEDASKVWKMEIDLKLDRDIHVTGFAALSFPGKTRGRGFSLFKKDRLIREKYLPQDIFGLPNSGASQRLFGELRIDGVGVSFSKDNFTWNEKEETSFKNELKTLLKPLISQANNYLYNRHDPETDRLKPQSKTEPEPDVEPKPEPDVEPKPEPDVEPKPEPDVEPKPEPDVITRQMVEVEIENELKLINLEQPIIYFIELPLGDVIKIGITTVKDLRNRIGDPQRYFVKDVKCLGIILCETREKSEEMEDYLLNMFGRANESRNQSELVLDNDEVRTYIKEECENPIFYEIASRRSRS